VHFDYSAEGIERSFEASCSRLGVERVATLLLHDIGAATHGDAAPRIFRQALDAALPTMIRLKQEGRVGQVGLGVNEWQVAMDVLDHGDLDVILLAGRYTLLDRSGEVLLDRAFSRGTEIWAAGIFNSGLLAGGNTYDYTHAPRSLIERRDRLAVICERYDVPLRATALQFAMRHPAVTMTLVGMRSPQEVAAAIADAGTAIPDALWRDLDAAAS